MLSTVFFKRRHIGSSSGGHRGVMGDSSGGHRGAMEGSSGGVRGCGGDRGVLEGVHKAKLNTIIMRNSILSKG